MITDRTQEDVTSKTAKGFYNTTDMNRVEAKVQELSDIFVGAGYLSNPVTKLDWSIADIPNSSDVQRYFVNIANLRAQIAVASSTPPTPMSADTTYEYEKMTFEMANDAEQILVDLEVLLNYITSPLYYQASGNAYVVSGGSSPWWRAAKVNSPSALIAAVIDTLEAYTWAELPDTITSETEAVSAVQDVVDGIVPDTMTATVTAVSYTNNYGQTGQLVFTVTVTYGDKTQTTSSLTVAIAEGEVVSNVELLESIKSIGTNYLETPYYPKPGTSQVEATFCVNTAPSARRDIMGAYGTTAVNGETAFIVRISNSNALYADMLSGLNKVTFAQDNTIDVEMNLTLDPPNGTINDTEYTFVTDQDRFSSKFLIFAAQYLSGTVYTPIADTEISKLNLGENDEWQHQYVPVRLLDSGLVTMYDYVSQTYLIPQGTGDFIAHSKDTPEYAYVDILN